MKRSELVNEAAKIIASRGKPKLAKATRKHLVKAVKGVPALKGIAGPFHKDLIDAAKTLSVQAKQAVEKEGSKDFDEAADLAWMGTMAAYQLIKDASNLLNRIYLRGEFKEGDDKRAARIRSAKKIAALKGFG